MVSWESVGQGAATLGGAAIGGIAGAIGGSHYAKYGNNADVEIANKIGLGTRKQDDERKKQLESQQQQQAAERNIFDRMNMADNRYESNFNSAANSYQTQRNAGVKDYLSQSQQLANQASQQANDANRVYQTDIAPRQKSIMEGAQREAGYAMSLQQAGDPNNAVHQAVRGMYDQRAQHAQQQGLHDYGVLAALGNQATAQQFGAGGPMTGGQMSVLQNANMGQASEAVARAQQYANSLRDQGIERGFSESDNQYRRGQDAHERYNRSVADYMNLEGTQQNRMRGYRDEQSGYNADQFGVRQGVASDDFNIGQQRAGIAHGNAMNAGTRDLQNIGSQYGAEQAYHGANAASQAAQQQMKVQGIGGLVQGGATAIGAMYGGPGGAAAGNAAGGAVSQAMSSAASSGNTYTPAQAPAQQPYYSPAQQPYYSQHQGGYAQGQPYSYGNGYG